MLNPAMGQEIQIGVAWDFISGQRIDIDAAVVMIDDCGTIVDAVYYNKLESNCKAITHSGDQRDGKK